MTSFQLILQLIPVEFLNTLYMVFAATLFSSLIGFPLGIILFLTDQEGLLPSRLINGVIGTIVNIGRSIPFAILIVAVIPLTRFIIGTSLGTTASIVPLTLAAAPFLARVVESALKEVDKGVIQATLIMGASLPRIVWHVLIRESLPALVRGMTLAVVTLIGYSALAGLVGGGGLGKVAIQYGYHRFNSALMTMTLVVLILFVEIIQRAGNLIATRLEKKRGIA